MTNFKEQLTHALQNPIDPTCQGQFEAILEEFCSWLNETYSEFLFAQLWNGSCHGQETIDVLIWPKNESHKTGYNSICLLRVVTGSCSVKIGNKIFSSEKELKKFLINFVARSNFRNLIERCKDHFEDNNRSDDDKDEGEMTRGYLDESVMIKRLHTETELLMIMEHFHISREEALTAPVGIIPLLIGEPFTPEEITKIKNDPRVMKLLEDINNNINVPICEIQRKEKIT